jgi:hypothetical protein
MISGGTRIEFGVSDLAAEEFSDVPGSCPGGD